MTSDVQKARIRREIIRELHLVLNGLGVGDELLSILENFDDTEDVEVLNSLRRWRLKGGKHGTL